MRPDILEDIEFGKALGNGPRLPFARLATSEGVRVYVDEATEEPVDIPNEIRFREYRKALGRTEIKASTLKAKTARGLKRSEEIAEFFRYQDWLKKHARKTDVSD